MKHQSKRSLHRWVQAFWIAALASYVPYAWFLLLSGLRDWGQLLFAVTAPGGAWAAQFGGSVAVGVLLSLNIVGGSTVLIMAQWRNRILTAIVLGIVHLLVSIGFFWSAMKTLH